jgi:hypothetical protein
MKHSSKAQPKSLPLGAAALPPSTWPRAARLAEVAQSSNMYAGYFAGLYKCYSAEFVVSQSTHAVTEYHDLLVAGKGELPTHSSGMVIIDRSPVTSSAL